MTNWENSPEVGGGAGAAQAPVFLVLDHDVLIAADIIGSLRMLGPCRALEARDVAEAADRIAAEPRISAAFVEMRYGQMVESGLDESLTRRGARIVLTVGENEQEAPHARGWSVLVRPFTDQMVRDKVT